MAGEDRGERKDAPPAFLRRNNKGASASENFVEKRLGKKEKMQSGHVARRWDGHRPAVYEFRRNFALFFGRKAFEKGGPEHVQGEPVRPER